MFPALTRGGPHAYGWLTSRGVESSVEVFKYAGRADTVLAGTRIDGEVDDDAKLVIGHTRWATHGSPLNLLNDHPIQHGHIVGVHNGVIRNYREILKVTGRQFDGTEVDSEAIFAAVNRWGHKKGIARIDGDMVAVYTDLRKPHIATIAKSDGRPCTIGWTKQGNLIWASEDQALKRLEHLGIEFTKLSGVRDFRILSIRAGQIINRMDYTPKVKRPVVTGLTSMHRPLRIPQPPVRTTTGTGHSKKTNDVYIGSRHARGVDGYFAREGRKNRVKADRERQLAQAFIDMAREEAASQAVMDADIDAELSEARTPEQVDNNLYYYNGTYLTAAEYVDVIRDEVGYE